MFEVATEAELCYLPELVGTIRVQLITLRLMVENVLFLSFKLSQSQNFIIDSCENYN